MRTAVVVPVFNNADTLQELAIRVDAALDDWSLTFVVDASPDSSGEVARRLADEDPRIRTVVLPVNVGQHRAIAHGLGLADDADLWVCLDADLQDPPEAIPSLVDELISRDAAGMFAGRRGRYESASRRWTGDAHRRALALLTRLPVDAGAFFAMNRQLRDAVVAGVEHQGAPSVVVAAAASRLPVGSTPVVRDVRPGGRSSWTASARLRQSVRTLGWAAARNQFLRFLTVGALGTVAYLATYLVLRLGMQAHVANIGSRVLVAVPTTWVNARHTFSSSASRRRIVTSALLALAVGTALSALSLVLEQSVWGTHNRPAEVVTLVVATVVATLARFVLLRHSLAPQRRAALA